MKDNQSRICKECNRELNLIENFQKRWFLLDWTQRYKYKCKECFYNENPPKENNYFKKYSKICIQPWCWKSFVVNSKKYENQKYCSKKCANKIRWPKTNESKEKTRESLILFNKKKKWENFVSLQSRAFSKICPFCKNDFLWIKIQIYCSRECVRKNRWPMTVNQKKNLSEIKKRMFASWELISKWWKTKWMEYRRTNWECISIQWPYELATCYILDRMKELWDIKDWIPHSKFNITYKWKDWTEHTYHPDFLVETNKWQFILETKWYLREHDIEKWTATISLWYNFTVWAYQDIISFIKKYNLDVKINGRIIFNNIWYKDF